MTCGSVGAALSLAGIVTEFRCESAGGNRGSDPAAGGILVGQGLTEGKVRLRPERMSRTVQGRKPESGSETISDEEPSRTASELPPIPARRTCRPAQPGRGSWDAGPADSTRSPTHQRRQVVPPLIRTLRVVNDLEPTDVLEDPT